MCERQAQFPDDFISVSLVKWTRRRQALAVKASRTVGDALMQLPRHCRVSPPAPTHIHTTTSTNTTITHRPARPRPLSLSLSSAARGSVRAHAHQATEKQEKNLVWLYLSLRSHVGFVTAINLVFLFRGRRNTSGTEGSLNVKKSRRF